MYLMDFQISKPLNFVLTGKFEAPSDQWIHGDEFPLVDYELIVATEGILYLNYAHRDYEVSPGEYLLLPPLPAPFNRRVGSRPSDCSFYWLHFTASHPLSLRQVHSDKIIPTAKNLEGKLLSIPRSGELANKERVIILMQQLQDSVRNHYVGGILDYMTTVILCEIHSQFIGSLSDTGLKFSSHSVCDDLTDYVHTHIKESLRISEIAAEFGYNPKYLSHLFASATGISLKQYILAAKINTANLMLTDTNMSMNEIALELGFSDNHSFSKAYKKVSGITPTQYQSAFSKKLTYHV